MRAFLAGLLGFFVLALVLYALRAVVLDGIDAPAALARLAGETAGPAVASALESLVLPFVAGLLSAGLALALVRGAARGAFVRAFAAIVAVGAIAYGALSIVLLDKPIVPDVLDIVVQAAAAVAGAALAPAGGRRA